MNVLILAAGMGRRVNSDIPKSLIKFNDGTCTLSRLIEGFSASYLVNKIIVVTGYNHNMFENLRNYYNVHRSKNIEFIYNADWNTRSNLYTLYTGLKKVDSFTDLLIVDADTFVQDINILNQLTDLLSYTKKSSIVTCDKVNSKGEWKISTDSDGVVSSVEIVLDNSTTKHITSGLVYFNYTDLVELCDQVKSIINKGLDLDYWDNLYVPSDSNKIKMIEAYAPGYLRFSEIDHPDDIEFINQYMIEESNDLYKRLYFWKGTGDHK